MTIRELAELAGVSPATISIVLNGKKGVSDRTRKNILELIEKHHYVHTRAKSFQYSEGDTVLFLKFRKHGMLVEENQGFISTIMDAVEESCRARDCRLSIVQVDSFEREKLEQIDFSLYLGVIVLGTELESEEFGLLNCIKIPYVVVDNSMRNWRCNAVGINNFENVHLALKYYKELGCQEIAYFFSSIQIENFHERHEAFMRYAKELDIKFRKENEFALKPTLMGAYEDMEKILDKNPDLPECVFADNDTIAIGAMKSLRKRGYHIPADISVIGFDDIPFAAINTPSLTTVRVQKELIGRRAVDLLFLSMEDPLVSGVKIQVTGDLILRSSVKKDNGC